jgi:ADP-ribose pyrophosphatase YjhB (NUDIX family)
MGHRVNSLRTNRRPEQRTRVVATALIERQEHLLLVQLARGRFAGFWLLPSAPVEQGTVAQAARALVPERTGCAVEHQELRGVLEHLRRETMLLRFVFATTVSVEAGRPTDPDVVQAAWFTRPAVDELLRERDVVPTLGVMALLRAWADGLPLAPLEQLWDEVVCPCGSGFRYPGCCGWDMD